jgi:uncharacterized protein
VSGLTSAAGARQGAAMPLAADLLRILMCPKSKSPLVYFPRGEANDDETKGFLYAPAARLRYRIEAGVPVLLVEEAEEVAPAEAQRLVARARELGLTAS